MSSQYVKAGNTLLFSICAMMAILIAASPARGQTTQGDIGAFKGNMIIEGDIVVPSDFYEIQGKSAWRPNHFWPNGIIPFEFNANVTQQNQQATLGAMAEWERVSGVDFILRTTESDYLHIKDSTANTSFVGRMGGKQSLTIYNWWQMIICHELMHALGFWHEQSRPNRDSYVQINWGNILPGDSNSNNFIKHEDAGQYGPYDFESIMHYNQCAFSVCTSLANPPYCYCDRTVDPADHPTITVLPPNQSWQSDIGQRGHLSHWDTLTVGFIYPREANWRFLDNERGDLYPDADGSFLSPFLLFDEAYQHVPSGGTIWITVPAGYTNKGTYTKAVTLRAPMGGVSIGN